MLYPLRGENNGHSAMQFRAGIFVQLLEHWKLGRGEVKRRWRKQKGHKSNSYKFPNLTSCYMLLSKISVIWHILLASGIMGPREEFMEGRPCPNHPQPTRVWLETEPPPPIQDRGWLNYQFNLSWVKISFNTCTDTIQEFICDVKHQLLFKDDCSLNYCNLWLDGSPSIVNHLHTNSQARHSLFSHPTAQPGGSTVEIVFIVMCTDENHDLHCHCFKGAD